jgi:hypothetical protein
MGGVLGFMVNVGIATGVFDFPSVRSAMHSNLQIFSSLLRPMQASLGPSQNIWGIIVFKLVDRRIEASRWMLVASHLFQLAHFGSFPLW